MKHINALLAVASVISAGGLLTFATGPPVQQAGVHLAGQLEMDPGSVVGGSSGGQLGAFFNLETGTTRLIAPEISMVAPSVDSNMDGFFETVFKVTLDPSSGYTKMVAVLDYEGVPEGFTLNIGDSATNDGGGGDYFTQQRDAEMQIVDQTLSVFASDLGSSPTNSTRISEMSLGLRDSGLKVSVGNMFLSHGSNYTEVDFSACPPGADLLFALDGQPDSEGPPNYDIYVGLNRVVYDFVNPDRIGSGLARVYITLE